MGVARLQQTKKKGGENKRQCLGSPGGGVIMLKGPRGPHAEGISPNQGGGIVVKSG